MNGSAGPSVVVVSPTTSSAPVVWVGDVDGATVAAHSSAAGSAASPSSVVFSPLDQLATAVTVMVPVVPASRSN